MDKKAQRLGMNYSTAAHRLRVDLLFHFATTIGHKCFRCGEELTRDTFSIEHKEPWLNSEDPTGLYFDINNIGFSHQSCNYSHGSKGAVRKYTPEEAALKKKESQRKWQTSERRREKYLRLGT